MAEYVWRHTYFLDNNGVECVRKALRSMESSGKVQGVQANLNLRKTKYCHEIRNGHFVSSF